MLWLPLFIHFVDNFFHADTNWTVYSQSIQSRLDFFAMFSMPLLKLSGKMIGFCHGWLWWPRCQCLWMRNKKATHKMTDESIQWQISDPLADFIIIFSMLFFFGLSNVPLKPVPLDCDRAVCTAWNRKWWISISSKLASIEKHDFEFEVLNKRNCKRSSVCIAVLYLCLSFIYLAAVPAEQFRSSINLLFAGKNKRKILNA